MAPPPYVILFFIGTTVPGVPGLFNLSRFIIFIGYALCQGVSSKEAKISDVPIFVHKRALISTKKCLYLIKDLIKAFGVSSSQGGESPLR
jgi:hypothetical protein